MLKIICVSPGWMWGAASDFEKDGILQDASDPVLFQTVLGGARNGLEPGFCELPTLACSFRHIMAVHKHWWISHCLVLERSDAQLLGAMNPGSLPGLSSSCLL